MKSPIWRICKWPCVTRHRQASTPADLDAYEAKGVQEVAQALEALKAAFARATAVGDSHLELSIGYHDAAQDGDRYDEVNGVFWAVDGLYQLSPAGRKFGTKVRRKFFVTFG